MSKKKNSTEKEKIVGKNNLLTGSFVGLPIANINFGDESDRMGIRGKCEGKMGNVVW